MAFRVRKLACDDDEEPSPRTAAASPALPPSLSSARNVPPGGATIDALVGRPLLSSRRFLIDSVVAIIGGGEGAIVVVPLALIVGINGVCELNFLCKLASSFVHIFSSQI